VAVLGLEHAGRNAGRVIVAGLFGELMHLQPARGLEVEHEDLRLQQRGRDPLAFAGNVALQQRGQNAHGAEKSGAKISDRNADPHGPWPEGRDRHQAAHALRDLVEARPFGVRPVLAEAGNTGEHDALLIFLSDS